jgi:hypothetical protein
MDNIRMDLGEVGWGNVDWIGLAQDRNRWRALGKLSSGVTTGGISSSAQFHRVSYYFTIYETKLLSTHINDYEIYYDSLLLQHS